MQFGRDTISGAKFAPSPFPLPSASGQGWAGLPPGSSSGIGSVLLSGNRQVVPKFRAFPNLILSLSLAIPLFKLLSHVSSLRLPSGHSGLVLTLSTAACSSPFRPHLLVADESICSTFLLGVAFRHVICGVYLFFLPVRLPSEIQKLPPNSPVRRFPGVWKLPLLRLPSWDRSPSVTLLSLFLSFIFCPTFFQRQWAAFLGV